MKKAVYVWRESVYKNDFRCSCGKILFEHGEPADGEKVDEIGYLYCGNCGKCVARVATVEMLPEETGMMGNYEEYLSRRRS